MERYTIAILNRYENAFLAIFAENCNAANLHDSLVDGKEGLKSWNWKVKLV